MREAARFVCECAAVYTGLWVFAAGIYVVPLTVVTGVEKIVKFLSQ